MWFCLWKMFHALDGSLYPDCACSRLSCLRWAHGTCYIQDRNQPGLYTGTGEGFQVSFLLLIKFHRLLYLLLLPEMVAFMEPIISKYCYCIVITRVPHCMDKIRFFYYYYFVDHFTLLNTWVSHAISWQIILLSCNSPWLTLVFTSLKTAISWGNLISLSTSLRHSQTHGTPQAPVKILVELHSFLWQRTPNFIRKLFMNVNTYFVFIPFELKAQRGKNLSWALWI